MENSSDAGGGTVPAGSGTGFYVSLVVLLFADAVSLACLVSPPSLMDDVDAVQAQIARNATVLSPPFSFTLIRKLCC